MKIYTGLTNERLSGQGVTVETDDGRTQKLNPRLDLWNHSPTGFSWGYGGSGPAQLALALIADATQDDAIAMHHYQQFKWDVIAKLDQDENWTLTQQFIIDWIAAQAGK